jgi:hypothetical protein
MVHLSVCELVDYLTLNYEFLNDFVNFVIVRYFFNLSLTVGSLQVFKIKQVLHHLCQLFLWVALQVLVADVEHVGFCALFLNCCEVILLVINLLVDPPVPPIGVISIVSKVDL